jgi:hypothetical protein
MPISFIHESRGDAKGSGKSRLSAGLSLAAAAAFDLLCSGTATLTSHGLQQPSTPLTARFRLDHKVGRWCEGRCSETSAFYFVSDREIILVDQGMGDLGTHMTINRASAIYTYKRNGLEGLTERATARCVSRPFSGFPRR